MYLLGSWIWWLDVARWLYHEMIDIVIEENAPL